MTVAIILFQGLTSLRRSYTVLLVMPMLPGGMPVGHGLDLFLVIWGDLDFGLGILSGIVDKMSKVFVLICTLKHI